jgi:hypothetical protein
VIAGDTLLFVDDDPQMIDDGTEDPAEVLSDAWDLPVTGDTTSGGRRWMWNDDGLLVSAPAAQA